MAWTTPITFVAAAALTAAQMNANVRDNTNALADRIQAVYKSADQNVNNSTTLVNDTELKFTAVAGQNYVIDMNILLACTSATPEFVSAFSFPAGTLGYSMTGLDLAATSVVASARIPATVSATTGVATATVATPSATSGVLVRGSFKCTTGGTVTFMWAQSVATAVNTTVSQGSTLTATRVAI